MNAVFEAIKEQMSGRKMPNKAPYRMKYPHSVEREYERALKDYLKPIMALIKTEIVPKLTSLKNLRQKELGFRDTSLDEIDEIFSYVQYNYLSKVPTPEQIALPYAEKTETFNKAQLAKENKSILGFSPITSEPWLASARSAFIKENVKLITSLPLDMLTQVERIVISGVETGISTKAMTAQIQGRFNVAWNRAELIANDQIGKYNGDLTRIRSNDLGLKKFIWRTAGDNAVRDTHRALSGNKYTWRSGAGGIYPGSEIRCRCTATNDYSVYFKG